MVNTQFYMVWEDGLQSERFDDIGNLANEIDVTGISLYAVAGATLVMLCNDDARPLAPPHRASCSGSFLFALAECYEDDDIFEADEKLFAEIESLGDSDADDDSEQP